MDPRLSRRVTAGILGGLPGWALASLGAGIAIVSLSADWLTIGGQPGIVGWKQWAGAFCGLAVAVAGCWIAIRLNRRQGGSTAASITTSADLKMQELPGPFYDSAAPRLPFVHELSELFEYRYLLANLVSRDLKVRYKRSVLGLLWAMANPLLTMAVMAAVFTSLFRFKVDHYPAYLLSGLLLWRLFSVGTTVAMTSVLSSADLSKKVFIPPSVFVAAAVGSALMNLLLALAPLLLLAIIMGVSPKISWLLLPIPVLEVALLTFGVGLVVASLAVFFADILDIYEVLISAFFYLTPIMYPITILPAFLVTFEAFNPMYHLIDWFRRALIDGQVPSGGNMLLTTLAVVAIALLGWTSFTRFSDQFPYRY